MNKQISMQARPLASSVWQADKVYVISNSSIGCNDPADIALVITRGLNQLGKKAVWVSPQWAFYGIFKPEAGALVVVAPQPRKRNEALIEFILSNIQVHFAPVARAAILDQLPRLLREGLVDFVHLSVDRMEAATGDYNVKRGLDKLAQLNGEIVLVVTNRQTAIAATKGQVFRQPALKVKTPVCSQGKSAAFLAAFLAIFIDTGDVDGALRAGHANGAAVAASWQAEKALLNRKQLDELIALDEIGPRTCLHSRAITLTCSGVLIVVVLAVILRAVGAL